MAIYLQALCHFATAYLDDILIYSETLEQHMGHLETVFDRLRQHGPFCSEKRGILVL